eukprot:356465-Chlamydomonas_euryale.AAC.2
MSHEGTNGRSTTNATRPRRHRRPDDKQGGGPGISVDTWLCLPCLLHSSRPSHAIVQQSFTRQQRVGPESSRSGV